VFRIAVTSLLELFEQCFYVCAAKTELSRDRRANIFAIRMYMTWGLYCIFTIPHSCQGL
jgi:hypothetical protein